MGNLLVYIASGFFNTAQLLDLAVIKNVLDTAGVNYFSPKDSNLANPNDSLEARKKVFDVNCEEIRKCDLIIVNTRDKDVGTIFEAGYAYANNKPIIYYWAGSGGHAFNLMLAESGIAVASNYNQLLEKLTKFVNDNNFKEQYVRSIE